MGKNENELVDKMPNEMFLRGVKYAIRELMDMGFFYKEDKQTVDARVILDAIYNNAVDFCDYGGNGFIRYYEHDKKGKPTKAIYFAGTKSEFYKKSALLISRYLLEKINGYIL